MNLLGAALVFVLTATAACKRPTPSLIPREVARVVASDAGARPVGGAVPAGSVQSDHFFIELAVYHTPVPRTDPAAALTRLLRGKPIRFVDTRPPEPPRSPTLWMVRPKIEDYAPFSTQAMEYFSRGLSPADKRALQGSKAVTVLFLTGPPSAALDTYRLALNLVTDLAANTGGILWDEGTREAFTREAWRKRLDGWTAAGPSVIPHITIHSYRSGDLIRLVTLGMQKLALPDLVVSEVAGSGAPSMSSVINLVCQTLLERPTLPSPGRLPVALEMIRHPGFRKSITGDIKPGASQKAVIQLARGRREKGDANNELLEIAFPGSSAELQVKHGQLIQQLFGGEDSLTHIEHDPEILAASRRALQTLKTLKPRFSKGAPGGEDLLVKAPFATGDGGTEWMWIEIVRWDGKTITGILQNDPFEVPGLKYGARVEVSEDALLDYLLRKADGTEQGNETGKVIERQQRRQGP